MFVQSVLHDLRALDSCWCSTAAGSLRCPAAPFTESIAELPLGARARPAGLRRHAGAAVSAGSSVSGVAAGPPVSCLTVHDAFGTHMPSDG